MGRAETDILDILRQDGHALQADLVRSTGYSRSTVSDALAALEGRKLVARTKEGRNARVSYLGGKRTPRGRLRLGFTRSAEYPFLVPLRRLLREGGVEMEFRVYDNAIAVARDLALGSLDVAVAPLVTLFMLHSLDAPFTLLGPAGAGGSSVMGSPRAALRGEVSAVCTKVSTMEALMRSAESRHLIPQISTLEYASSPAQIESALMSGSADLCSIWEPYATILESRGARRLVRYSELGDHVCCAAAVGNHVEERELAALSECYPDSLDAVRTGRDSYRSAYAALAGLDASMLRRVEHEYTYPHELSPSKVSGQLRAAGMSFPAPEAFAAAVSRGATRR